MLTVTKNATGVFITPTGSRHGPTAKVVTPDIKADNGIIHIIDTVLSIAPAAAAAAPTAEP
jgi:uncharacterized surface protein with fasciclin (FAS1) repeats